MTSFKKIFFITIMGNILEYYDFLLFAHLGFIIAPIFFPVEDPMLSHLFSLLLFGLAFVARPIGGWLFGRLADKNGRKAALISALFWTSFPAFGLALLPGYEVMGIMAAILFAGFRFMQGITVGGEYPNVGTYIMEFSPHNKGFLSGMLGASGSVGSLFALGFAVICLQPDAPDWLWRVGFLLGAIGAVVGYGLRKILTESPEFQKSKELPLVQTTDLFIHQKQYLTFLIGAIIGITVFIPMTYTNFYVTKTLGFTSTQGLFATLIGLITYITFTPIFGYLSDKTGHIQWMKYSTLISAPLGLLFFYFLLSGHVWLAQVALTLLAASVAAPVHPIINGLYSTSHRAKNVALYFMSGASIGGLAPSISGYLANVFGFIWAPAWFIFIAGIATYLMIIKLQHKKGL